ncbi:MAG: hypothetical protein A2X18_12065 [Bacteroidetes bacterium GWF2_40_14]|nr:MAG: hypothetical protein A2X18_12065 [Bacteroidetes bacterium GWF2_40_14]
MGEVRRIDSTWTKVSAKDSILTLSYDLSSRFDPLNPVDTALKPSARWYYFRMDGVKGKQIFLNIQNSEAIRPFYSYDGINFRRFDEGENLNKRQVNKIFTQDTVFISHFIPYKYSRLSNKIEQWRKCEYVDYREIGKSHLGVSIPMLTITDRSVPDQNKKRIWIHGRAHPSEQPCSWHLEAMINELTSGSEYSKSLLSHSVFYIVPMINPDGVIGGFSRSSSTGVNVEINWDREDSLTTPEIQVLKAILTELTEEIPFDLFLNMHSQIANSATYWIHTAESTSPVTYKNQLLLSNLTVNENPFYSSKDQSFSDMAPRYPEGWMWNRFGDKTVAITFETPYTYYKENIDGDWVSVENLSRMGMNSLYAISDYLDISTSSRLLVNPRIINKRRWTKTSGNSDVFFEDFFHKALSKRAKVIFYAPDVKQGEYKIYSWSVGPADKVSPDGKNCWSEVAEVRQKRDGKLRLRLKADSVGGVVDKFLLVK